MFNKLLIIGIILLLTSPCVQAAEAQNMNMNKLIGDKAMNLSQSIDKIRSAIVQISLKIKHSPEEMQKNPKLMPVTIAVIGTGFIIDTNGRVVTALHVVREAKKIINAQLMLGLAMPNMDTKQLKMSGNFSYYETEQIAEDEIHDLAILILKPNPFIYKPRPSIKMGDKEIGPMYGVSTIGADRPKDGELIAVSGYPFDGSILITNSGYIASSWSVERHEMQLPGGPIGFTIPELSDVYLADLTINPGNSGGPAYRVEDGTVIGVCVSQRLSEILTVDPNKNVVHFRLNGQPMLYNAGVANIIPIKYVLDLLKK